jgi:hypothetical protein
MVGGAMHKDIGLMFDSHSRAMCKKKIMLFMTCDVLLGAELKQIFYYCPVSFFFISGNHGHDPFMLSTGKDSILSSPVFNLQ